MADRQPLNVALAQMDPTVGDIGGNAARIAELTARARDEGASLVVFPELALTGYPPEDLLLKTHFLEAAAARARRSWPPRPAGSSRWWASPSGRTTSTTPRRCWPTARSRPSTARSTCRTTASSTSSATSRPGDEPALVELNGVTLGLTICEDIWEPGPPASTEALAGAEVIVNLSASPYHAGKGGERERMLAQRARDSVACVLFCNTVGGQDELVFDGHSVAIDQDGELLARAPQFEEALVHCTIDPNAVVAARLRDPAPPRRRSSRARGRRPACAAGGVVERPGCRRPGGGRRGQPDHGGRGGGLRGAAHGPARLRREERLRPGRAGALRGNRQRPGGAWSPSTRSGPGA